MYEAYIKKSCILLGYCWFRVQAHQRPANLRSEAERDIGRFHIQHGHTAVVPTASRRCELHPDLRSRVHPVFCTDVHVILLVRVRVQVVQHGVGDTQEAVLHRNELAVFHRVRFAHGVLHSTPRIVDCEVSTRYFRGFVFRNSFFILFILFMIVRFFLTSRSPFWLYYFKLN